MGLYIKGMEMPKDKPVIIQIMPDGSVRKPYRDVFLKYESMKATIVPDHGRLIDADALIKEFTLGDEDDKTGATLLMAVFLEVLKAAPTIIEAEEGE